MTKFTRVESVGRLMRDQLELSAETQDALQTTPPNRRVWNWLVNRGRELIIPEMSVDLTRFPMRMRDLLWSLLGDVMRSHQPGEVVLVDGRMLSDIVAARAFGDPSFLFGYHASALYIPEVSQRPRISSCLASDIRYFVRGFEGGAVECPHFRMFVDGDDVVGHAYQPKESRVLPARAPLYDPDESTAEARAAILAQFQEAQED